MVTLISFFFSPLFAASPPGFYDLELENLNSFSQSNTAEMKGANSVWVLFQPDCASCKVQLGDLECLDKKIVTVAAGINGSRDRLNAALRPTGFAGRRYKASKALEQIVNTTATPTIFFVNEEGRLLETHRGALTCTKLQALLNQTFKSDSPTVQTKEL